MINPVRAHFPGDIAVIDDGCEDETAALARAAGVAVLQHPRNFGIGAAVQTSFVDGLHGGDNVAPVHQQR